MEKSQCDYCLYYDYYEDTDEYYCSLNIDQDDVQRLSYSNKASCPYFRMGDDYTIAKKQ